MRLTCISDTHAIGTLAEIGGWGNTPVQSGPVQLRKVIVPGVYGKVKIEDVAGRIGILVDDYFDRSDLIAARDVFNALIDAMEE